MLYNTKTNRKVDVINPTEYADLYTLARIRASYIVTKDGLNPKDSRFKDEIISSSATYRIFGDYTGDRDHTITDAEIGGIYANLVEEETAFQFFNNFENRELAKKFYVAVVFKFATTVNTNDDNFFSGSNKEIELTASVSNVPLERTSGNGIVMRKCNAMDFSLYDEALYEQFLLICKGGNVPWYMRPNWNSNPIKVVVTSEDAVVPTKKRRSDTGLDITLIKKIKTDEFGTEWYDTGLQIEPPTGYYTELVGRSSLIKKGRQLANCVGIVDETYRNNLLVCLTKLHPDAPELELPNRACQLILRKNEIAHFEKVTTLSNTERGLGGFGSTGL